MTTTNVHHQPRRPLSLIMHQCRYDLRAFRRDRQAAITTIVMPLVLLVAFVGLAGHHSNFAQDGHKISVAQFYVPGLIPFAVVASSFRSLLVDLMTLRQSGILKRRRATPVSAWALIGDCTLCCAVLVLGTSAALLFIGRNNYNVHFASAALLAVLLTTTLGTAAFCCFAYAIAPFIRNIGATQPIIQLVLLPLYIISGVRLPDSKNPEVLRPIARVFPFEHIANGLHRAFSVSSPEIGMTATDLAVLASWVVVGLASPSNDSNGYRAEVNAGAVARCRGPRYASGWSTHTLMPVHIYSPPPAGASAAESAGTPRSSPTGYWTAWRSYKPRAKCSPGTRTWASVAAFRIQSRAIAWALRVAATPGSGGERHDRRCAGQAR